MENQPSVNFVKRLCTPLILLALMFVVGFAVLHFSPTTSQAEAQAPAPQKNYGNLISTIPLFDVKTSEYVLTAWSRNGIQHVSDTDGAWTLLPPGNVLEAQLIKRTPKADLITEGVTISYRLENEIQGQVNTAEPLKITNAPQPLGRQLTGTGNGLPNPAAQVSGVLKLGADKKSFTSGPIPILPYTEDGSFLPYPLVVVEAKDSKGKLLAYTRAVLPVSSELGCYKCHGGTWSKGVTGISKETALNILKSHDANHNTKLATKYEKAQEARTAGKTGVESYGVNCRTCHNDVTKGRLNISTSMHAFHANKMQDYKGADACATCHPSQKTNMGKGDPAGFNTDGKGGATYYMRDVHATKAMDCISCHGPMEDLSLSLLLQARNEGKGHADVLIETIKPVKAKSIEELMPRKAWVNEPDCLSCHNQKTKIMAHDITTGRVSSFNKWTKDANGLYINSHDGSSGLRCASCHGSPHALYPANNPYSPNRDNIQPLQYQKTAGPIGGVGNCNVCHAEKVAPKPHHPLPVWEKRNPLVVSVPAGKELNMWRVPYPHDPHGSLECGVCHHTGYEGEKLRCTSSGCHDGLTNDPAKPYRSFFTAFHGPERGCLSCHVNLRAEGKATGPIDCTGCHTERPIK